MCVDDIFVVSSDPKVILKYIHCMVRFNNNKIEVPESYLELRLQLKILYDIEYWTITIIDYINANIEDVEQSRPNYGRLLLGMLYMTTQYALELDEMPELDSKDHQYYQEIIGMLIWATDLGRVYILLVISILSQCQACPR